MRLSKFLATTSAVVFALTGSQLALAEAAPGNAEEAKPAALDVIVVTAEKRPENLQNTPIAVSVLNTAGLEDRHVISLTDLGDGAIPSLKVAPFFSRPGALIMNIRGIGVLSDSNQPARDQGVGIYVDGVYLGRPQGLGTALSDVESIEVLKGPQGTLFGRNTEGGAVQITTKKPTGKFGLTAKGGLSNYGGYDSELHVDFDKIGDFSFKFDGLVSARDGWVKNPLVGASDFGGYDKRALRARVLWEPATNFTVDYAYDNAFDSTTTLYQQLLAKSTYPTALKVAAINVEQPSRASVASIGTPEQPSEGSTYGHRLTADWKLSDSVSLKSISSYRKLKQGQYDNGSVAQSPGVFSATGNFLNQKFGRYSLASFDQDQFSQEFQLIGEMKGLKYVAGALYYREEVSDDARTYTTNQFTDAAGLANTILSNDLKLQTTRARASEVTTISTGVFGQATYTPPVMNDALHITAGGRWTKDEKDGTLLIVNGALPVNPLTGVGAPIPLNKSWSRFDPMANVAFDVTKDIMVYGKYSTGYRSGGANSRSTGYRSFNPETVKMFELGAKTEFFNNRARLNVSAYTGDYESIQLDFSGLYVTVDPVTKALVTTLRTTTDTVNAPGKGKLSGFEADFTLAVTDNLTLSANYAYNKVKIPSTVNPFPQSTTGGSALSTVPVPIYQVYTPENSASAAADYEMPFRNMKVLAHLDANYGEGYYANYTDSQVNFLTGAVTIKQPKGDDSFIVNGRVSLADIPAGPGRATLSLWARNLLDEEHVFVRFLSDTAGQGGFFNEPRTYGIELKLKM